MIAVILSVIDLTLSKYSHSVFIILEIGNYLNSKSDNKPDDAIEFLIKVWRSGRLSTHKKYDSILKYFTIHIIPRLDNADFSKIKEFLHLNHPTGSVSDEIRSELVKNLIKELKRSPTFVKIQIALEISSLESFRDLFKENLCVHAKLFKTILNHVKVITNNLNENEMSDLKTKIIEGLFLLVKVEGFEKIFLNEILVTLDEVYKGSTTHYELLKNVFFHEVGSMESRLTIFNDEMPKETKFILVESFIGIHQSKPDEISRLFESLTKEFLENPDDSDDFMQQIGYLFELIMKHEVEYSTLKKQNSELFDDISERIITSLATIQETIGFQDFLNMLHTFFSCDPFLLEKSLFSLIIDCMFKEKSAEESKAYERLMVAVLKTYGKDLSEFVVKFLKKLDKKLQKYQIPIKKKRKMMSESETTPIKKRRLSETNSREIYQECTIKARFWPELAMSEFNEICSGMNVAQSQKIIGVLNQSLVDCLKALKESMAVNENFLFKVNLLSTFLCSIFEHSRIMEQLMSKTTAIVTVTKQVNSTFELFGQIILSIEYNSRLVNDYLSLLKSFDSFMMLYCYHFDANTDRDFDSIFIEDQFKGKHEWEIIQQRIKNFGKFDELNNLNLLMIQQSERNQIFNKSKVEVDITTVLSDEMQIEFLLQKPEIRIFIINSLNEQQILVFIDFLTNVENEEILNLTIEVISKNPNLVEKFSKTLTEKKENEDVVLKILAKLPLWCASDEVKQNIFKRVLNSKIENLLHVDVMEKLLRNDGFKSCLKDNKMKEIFGKFGQNQKIFEMILRNSAKKMSLQVLENFNWIVRKGENELIETLSGVINEVRKNLNRNSQVLRFFVNQTFAYILDKYDPG